MSFLQPLRPLSLNISRRSLWVLRTYSTPASSSSTPKKPTGSASQAAAPKSSCPADTVMKGANYLKGQTPVVAKPDEEYPEWLWSVLKPRVYEDDGPGGKKERAERRKANRQAIKDRNFMQTQ